VIDRRPWRDRPPSFARGLVRGCMVGGLGGAGALLIVWPITGEPIAAVFAGLYGIAGVCGTYLWTVGR
jgi:hypothetical protein